MKKSIILILIMFRVTVAFAQSTQPSVIRHVAVDDFKRAMDSLKDEIVVDLRTPDEVENGGKIANAIHIDFFGSDFEPALAKLNKDKVYLLYCASGGRSGETVGIMQKMGFRRIYNLEEGFRGWVRKKMPVVK